MNGNNKSSIATLERDFVYFIISQALFNMSIYRGYKNNIFVQAYLQNIM